MDQRLSDGGIKSLKSKEERRKRINRIKTVIIIIVTILIILPTVGCIVLGVQLGRLQKQVNDLLQDGNHNEISMIGSNENYAFAAQRADTDNDVISGQADASSVKEGGVPGAEKNPLSGINQKITDGQTRSKGTENEIINEETREHAKDLRDALNHTEDSNSTETSDDTVAKAAKSVKKSDTADNKNSGSNNNTKNENKSLNIGKYEGKKVYLTFDDGPSIYTNDILDILAKNKVKATFFVVGKTDKNSLDMYQKIIDEGHTLGMHSYSHVYKQIYNSVQDFDKDFTKLRNLLYDTTGYEPSIYRFPGGSANLVSKASMKEFVRYLNEKSIRYFDWNVENGDETGVDYTKDQLVKNVLDGIAQKRTSIVLMHDSVEHKKTLDSLPDLIETLISGGAEIAPIDDSVTPIQQIKADSVQ